MIIMGDSVINATKSSGRKHGCSSAHIKSGKVFPYFTFFVPWLLLLHLLLMPSHSTAFYVGPEVGKAPGETRVTKVTRGFGFGSPNATSLAEAAYVPYVYAVGDNVVTFLRSIIPALQPKVDFIAEQIQDTIDTTNGKLMQKLENSNNGIIAVENFFTGLMKAIVLGRGPDDDERRRRLALALIRSGMLAPSTTTTSTTSTTTVQPTMATTITTGIPVKLAMSTSTVANTFATATTTTGTEKVTTQVSPPENITPNNPPMASLKARDNDFNKMKVIKIVKNML